MLLLRIHIRDMTKDNAEALHKRCRTEVSPQGRPGKPAWFGRGHEEKLFGSTSRSAQRFELRKPIEAQPVPNLEVVR